MKKWYQWLYLSAGFALGGFLNFLEGKRIVASVMQVLITVVLALIQYFCDRKGDQGKKTFRHISIIVFVLLAAWLAFLLLQLVW